MHSGDRGRGERGPALPRCASVRPRPAQSACARRPSPSPSRPCPFLPVPQPPLPTAVPNTIRPSRSTDPAAVAAPQPPPAVPAAASPPPAQRLTSTSTLLPTVFEAAASSPAGHASTATGGSPASFTSPQRRLMRAMSRSVEVVDDTCQHDAVRRLMSRQLTAAMEVVERAALKVLEGSGGCQGDELDEGRSSGGEGGEDAEEQQGERIIVEVVITKAGLAAAAAAAVAGGEQPRPWGERAEAAGASDGRGAGDTEQVGVSQYGVRVVLRLYYASHAGTCPLASVSTWINRALSRT